MTSSTGSNLTPPGQRIFSSVLAVATALIVCIVAETSVFAQSPCVRYPQGSVVAEPENLYSKDGLLQVNFTYQTSDGPNGLPLYCFVNSDGVQSPTLHVSPGDKLVLTLTNLVPDEGGMGRMAGMPEIDFSKAGAGGCGAMNMTSASVNVHYHGTNIPPVCHQDEVIPTIVNSGETFRYEMHIPGNEP